MDRDSAAAWQGRATGGRVTPKSSFSGHSQKPTKQQPSSLTCEIRCNCMPDAMFKIRREEVINYTWFRIYGPLWDQQKLAIQAERPIRGHPYMTSALRGEGG